MAAKGGFMNFSRSDLACEKRPVRDGSDNPPIHRFTSSGFAVSEMVVGEGYDCPKGRYVTIETGRIWQEDIDRIAACEEVIAGEISKFAKKLAEGRTADDLCILVAGLGNRFMTADSLGPLTVDKLTVTRHVMGVGGYFDRIGCSKLCAVQPGVLGQTGIEAAAIIKGACEEAKPDIVIAVDALAARSIDRLATTVQISDTGICPGSGIGNRRTAIDRNTLGCHVIAVGIPTIVDSSTLVCDALEQAGIEEIPHELRTVLETGRSFFVSPKDSDIIADELSSILASAIGIAAGI